VKEPVDYEKLAAESRAKQGLPPKITDPVALAKLARMLVRGRSGSFAGHLTDEQPAQRRPRPDQHKRPTGSFAEEEG
jgi:hypothetical protein